MLRCLAVFVVVASIYLAPLLHRMPAPYDDVTAVSIEASRIALYPGAANGSKFPADLTGAYARNERLWKAQRLFQGEVFGSESVAVMPNGDLIMLDKFAYVHRARPAANGGYEMLREGPPLYIGPGRPLGFHVIENGTALLVCDSLKGLVRVDLPTGTMSILSNRISASGKPFHYANDLDVALDGTVYFSSSTQGTVARNAEGFYDTMQSYLLQLVRGDASGQLLTWDPATKQTSVVLDGLSYANGVAVSADGAFVAVVETNHARVLRLWLKGSKAGQTEILVDKLPGMPDGLTQSVDGGFWLSLVVPVPLPLVSILAPYPSVRQLLSHVTGTLSKYLAKQWGCVVRLSSDGMALETLMDPDGSHVSTVSAVTEHDGKLFLGNLGGDFVSVIAL